jgi:signal transduction histidine kinase
MQQQLLTRKQEARIRNRIAANLHDELGSLLLRIQLQTETLLMQPREDEVSLERLLHTTRSACSAMRDVAWGLDAEADTMNALEDRMRDLLDQLALSTPLHIRFAVEGLEDVAMLPARLRQELYLVFKEATTNAVRHAQSPVYLAVRLYRQKNSVVLDVQDDGRAMPVVAQAGMGLRNMRRRALAVGGTLDAAPRADGPGFRVRFCAPLHTPAPLKWPFRG